MIRRPPRSTHCISSAASDVYKRQVHERNTQMSQSRTKICYKSQSDPEMIKKKQSYCIRRVMGKKRIWQRNFLANWISANQKLKKTEEFIQNEKMRLEEKDQNKEVALGTSKTNYNDPRISTSWCKCVELPIDKVFNNSLMQKFVWAMETEPEWKF
eukprot:TRINITY_DN31894_c0_g1_i1.p1 TRINITY_DN31894_c0_g1~~TRINITY_DN31894_c0_g1_i1.p1  ORF type:complete len:156 (+),score=38.83 TRINITY_DN31894_c0_g1_i1:103-570(+)